MTFETISDMLGAGRITPVPLFEYMESKVGGK
jgi:hypothetical protein